MPVPWEIDDLLESKGNRKAAMDPMPQSADGVIPPPVPDPAAVRQSDRSPHQHQPSRQVQGPGTVPSLDPDREHVIVRPRGLPDLYPQRLPSVAEMIETPSSNSKFAPPPLPFTTFP